MNDFEQTRIIDETFSLSDRTHVNDIYGVLDLMLSRDDIILSFLSPFFSLREMFSCLGFVPFHFSAFSSPARSCYMLRRKLSATRSRNFRFNHKNFQITTLMNFPSMSAMLNAILDCLGLVRATERATLVDVSS